MNIISASEVHELLSMQDCIAVLDQAMRAVSSGSASVPQRLIEPLPDARGYMVVMPGMLNDPAVYGAKIVSLHPDNPSENRPAVQGFVVVFDHQTGKPVALIDGGAVTAIRTAAASGLATRELARHDARSLGIFGNGMQAAAHIDAVKAVRSIDRVIVWGRNHRRAEEFVRRQMERSEISLRATEDPAEAGACDVICTTTSSAEPILQGSWIQPGAHINLVGAHAAATREADSAAVAMSSIYFDYYPSLKNEGGDILIPVKEGVLRESDLIGEIGALLNGEVRGREGRDEVTLYNSLGVVAQDLYVAAYIADAAREKRKGTNVELDS